MIQIISPGMLSTVQDFGRMSDMKNGFPQCGAMDALSMKTANRLVGNCLGCAVIEMTVTGITARFDEECVICISGGDFGATLSGRPIRTNKAYAARKGSVIKMGAAKTGLRAYLAVSGGISVPIVLGSASTDLKSQIGGVGGRKLQAGDVLSVGTYCYDIGSPSNWQTDEFVFEDNIVVRVVPGPQDTAFDKSEIEKFFSSEYSVTPKSDRMGIRLDGDPVFGKNGNDIISDAIVFGSVQVPKDGKPIVLMADHQTTGGYAKIATVISTDLQKLAQAKPGTKVRFEKCTVEQAEKLKKREKRYFDNLFFFQE